MIVWRIALGRYAKSKHDALSGLSGFSVDGRWHAKGRFLDYTAESLSLAVLERIVHYKRFDHLAPHVLCTIDLPPDVVVPVDSVPRGWNGLDFLPAAQALGNHWHDAAVSPVLRVPSIVSEGEHNFLLNTRHPDWRWQWVRPLKPFSFDHRIRELLRPSTLVKPS